jgi:transcriptional accessory protein Tex/SPT6
MSAYCDQCGARSEEAAQFCPGCGRPLGGLKEALTQDIAVGMIYVGKVVRIMNFGAFVEILPEKDGLLHVSRLADHRVNRVEDVVNIGDEVMVKVIEIDERGRVNLTRIEHGGDAGAGVRSFRPQPPPPSHLRAAAKASLPASDDYTEPGRARTQEGGG